MPGRRNPRAKWVLPEVIDPPDHICITIPVPNDRQHIAAFWGALYNLTSGIFWSDDTAHTARLVAKVWQKIYDDLAPSACDITAPIAIDEWEDELSICESLRLHNGKLQGLCCGEWSDIPGQEGVLLGGPGQPGADTPQPDPAGGQQCYHASFAANYQWLLPTNVSAGDVLTFSNFEGAATDTNGFAASRWDCPDGQLFALGTCQGAQSTVPGDPAPALHHMTLIANIAGTYYDITAGPITVPGGVSNAQCNIFANDSNYGDNSGSYGFDVCVTNNQAVQYCKEADFATGQQGWIPGSVSTSFSGGAFHGAPTGSSVSMRAELDTVAPFTFGAITVKFSVSHNLGTGTNLIRLYDAVGTLLAHYDDAMVNGNSYTDRVVTFLGNVALVKTVIVGLDADNAIGAASLSYVKVCAIGSNPF